jgi:hypothetical protein
MEPKLMRVGEPGDSLTAPSGLRMTLVETPGTTDGRRLVMDWEVPPGRRIVAADHVHPDGPEVWRIQEGSAGYRLGGEVKDNGDIDDRLQNALTIYALLVPGTFLAGPPRWLQRGAFAAVSALARALGREPYLRPEFDR